MNQNFEKFLEKLREPKVKRLLEFIVVILILIGTQFCYAGQAILLKAFAYNTNIHPVLFSLLRDIICLPLMFILSVTVEGPVIPKFKDVPIFVSLGFTGIFGNQIGFIVGVYMVGSSMAAIFQPSIPVWTLLLALIFGMEPFKLKTFWIKGLGVMCVVGGALLMMILSMKSGGDSKRLLLGNGFLIMNCICMAIYILIQKRFLFKSPKSSNGTSGAKSSRAASGAKSDPSTLSLATSSQSISAIKSVPSLQSLKYGKSPTGMDNGNDDSFADGDVDDEDYLQNENSELQKPKSNGRLLPWWKPLNNNSYPPFTVTFFSYFTGSIFLLIAAMLCFGFQDHKMFSNISPWVLIPLLYASLIQSLVVYSLISYANSKVSSTIVTSTYPVQVPVTIILSAIFFKEQLSWNAYLGAALVCGGLLVVCIVKYYEEEMDQQPPENKQEQQFLLESTLKQEEGVLINS